MPKKNVYVAELSDGTNHETWSVVAPNKVEAEKKVKFLSSMELVCLSVAAAHCVKRHWRAG